MEQIQPNVEFISVWETKQKQTFWICYLNKHSGSNIKHSALVQAGLVVKLRYKLIGEIQTRPLSADPTPKLSIGKSQTGRLT